MYVLERPGAVFRWLCRFSNSGWSGHDSRVHESRSSILACARVSSGVLCAVWDVLGLLCLLSLFCMFACCAHWVLCCCHCMWGDGCETWHTQNSVVTGVCLCTILWGVIRVPHGGEVPRRCGFQSGRKFASCLKRWKQGKFSVSWFSAGAGCCAVSWTATRIRTEEMRPLLPSTRRFRIPNLFHMDANGCIGQSTCWTKVCETARSGNWVLKGDARIRMLLGNLKRTGGMDEAGIIRDRLGHARARLSAFTCVWTWRSRQTRDRVGGLFVWMLSIGRARHPGPVCWKGSLVCWVCKCWELAYLRWLGNKFPRSVPGCCWAQVNSHQAGCFLFSVWAPACHDHMSGGNGGVEWRFLLSTPSLVARELWSSELWVLSSPLGRVAYLSFCGPRL